MSNLQITATITDAAKIEATLLPGKTQQASGMPFDNTASGLTATTVQGAIDDLASEKVDKVTGKGLSTEDYTTAEKSKVANLPADTNASLAEKANKVIDTVKDQNTVTGVTDIKFWTGMQAEYDLLTPSSDTIYFIKEVV